MRMLKAGVAVAYEEALAFMHSHVEAMQMRGADELIWFLEHSSLYTAGISAKPEDLLESHFPIFHTKRGGQYTYHGSGQRIIYAMLDLKERGRDVRQYVLDLQVCVIAALAEVGVRAFCRDGRVGLWVHRDLEDNEDGYEDKIASIGVRVQKWITSHGISINIDTDLSHFSGIVPCGIADKRLGVTSLAALGIDISMSEFDEILRQKIDIIFVRD